MQRRIAVVMVLVGLVFASCGTPSDGPTAEPEPNLPTLSASEAPAHLTTAVTGTMRSGSSGCWALSLPDEERPVIFPSDWSESDDGSTLIDPSAEPAVLDGGRIEGTAGVVQIDQLPAAAAAWITACDPDATSVVILDTLMPYFDTEAMTDAGWVALLESADFTESWDCGIGFAASTIDQRVAIVIHANDMGVNPEAVVTLPDTTWVATVLVGSRLMANWCNDAIEAWAADPVIAATWTIGGGTLSHDPTPDTGCLSKPITGTLAGAVVATPEGPATLDTVTMVNHAYGCFAG